MAGWLAVALQVAGTGMSMWGSMYGGVQAKKSSKTQASMILEEGEYLRDESYRQATIVRRESKAFAQEQKMQYISAGVEIYGTPIEVIAETKRLGEEEAKALELQGDRFRSKAQAEAKAVRKKGKNAYYSGIVEGLGGGAQGIGGMMGKK